MTAPQTGRVSVRVRRRRAAFGALAAAVVAAGVAWAAAPGSSSRSRRGLTTGAVSASGRRGSSAGGYGSGNSGSSSASGAAGAQTAAGSPWLAPGTGDPHLQPGSDPGVLPGALLIADEGNDRVVIVDAQGRMTWSFPQPGDLPAGVEFKSPDDAFFTPDGKQIIATEEEFSVITLIDIATRRIVWRYGTPGTPGAADNQLSNPDDAIVLPDGHVVVADIKNCRILLIAAGAHTPERVYGTTTQACHHAPPSHFGSPNGAFPLSNGHYLVTEINGDWVDEMDLSGKVFWSVHPPGVAYPSDTNEVHPGTFLTVDYSDPGMIETFDTSGRLLWRYRPSGGEALNQPSLALPLPNGDVIATDDHNDRVIVVDPRTNTIVWQYGVRGQPGAGPGFLNGPDGLDLAPPNAELAAKAGVMGLPVSTAVSTAASTSASTGGRP